MTAKTWIIETPEQLANFLLVAKEWKVEKPIYIKVSTDRVRTIEQNAKLHTTIREEIVKDHKEWAGQEWDVVSWKKILSSGYQKHETDSDPKLIMGLEGEIVNMSKDTHEMGVKELSGLIEYILAWRYG